MGLEEITARQRRAIWLREASASGVRLNSLINEGALRQQGEYGYMDICR